MLRNQLSARLTRRDAMRLLGVGAAGLVGACGGEMDSGPPVSSIPAPDAGVPPAAPTQPVIRTILRDVAPEELGDGAILMHEHLSATSPFPFQPQPDDPSPHFTSDVDLITEEVRLAGADGVACIVEAGHAYDLGRNLDAIRSIASGSGVHIVGTGGFWRGPAHPPDIATKSVEQITDELVEEAQREGYGAFGETGTSAPMTDDERKVFTATARAHLRTGIPIFTHNPYPGEEPEAALRQLDIFEAEGVDLNHLVIGHVCCLDQPEADVAIEVASRGASVGFDRFGWANFVEDSKRVAMIVKLVEAGHADKVVLSSDFFREEQLQKSGGPGFSKVVTVFAPMMRETGLDEATVSGFLRDNSLRWLAFRPQIAREAA